MKTKTLLIAAVMFLGLSAVAFSQAIFSTSSTPVTTVIATGNAELTGSITFTSNGAASVLGTISIQYGGTNVNITSPFANVTITGTGTYTGLAGLPTVYNTPTSQYSPGLLVISIPAVGAGAGSFTISGVRVQVNGTGLTNLVATISATGNQIAAGSTSLTVINSTTGSGIASGGVASFTNAVPIPTSGSSTLTPGAPTINSVTGLLSGGSNTTITVKEGFLAAFTPNVGVRITVSATPPKGVTFTFPQTAISYDVNSTANTSYNTWVLGNSTSTTMATAAQNITSSSTSTSSLQVFYYVATDVGDTTIETLEIPVTITSNTASETFPLPTTPFTYTVSLAPVQGPYQTSGSNSGTPIGLLSPRFAASEVGPAVLLNATGSSTTLLIPYAYASSTAGDFRTAMAVANTTEDPNNTAGGSSTILGFTGAVAQNGPITFYFFPSGAATTTAYKYTTAAGSPGAGLDASGNIVSGGTYSVFLDQILPLATALSGTGTLTLPTAAAGGMTGYVMIVANFTNAHGIFVISNFTTLTAQSSLMQVLSDRSVLPER